MRNNGDRNLRGLRVRNNGSRNLRPLRVRDGHGERLPKRAQRGGQILVEGKGLAEAGDGGGVGLGAGAGGLPAVSGGAQDGVSREGGLDGRRRGESVGNRGDGVNHLVSFR